MEKIGTTIVRVVALTSGVIVGVYLAQIAHKFMNMQTQERHDYEKCRYAQGLTPVEPQPYLEGGLDYERDNDS